MIFEQKKISIETLSEYLSGARSALGLSIEEVAERAGVVNKFIEYLEEGRYNSLPPDVYVIGFLKQIAQVYSVSSDLLIEQFKKERGIVEQANQKQPLLKKTNWKKPWEFLTITPKFLSLAGASLLILVTVGYLTWQVTSLSRAPRLKINEPSGTAVIKDSVIRVSGTTDPGAIVTINNQAVLVESSGQFSAQISVSTGQKELAIESKNKFNHVSQKTIPIVIETPQVLGAETQTPAGQLPLSLQLHFRKGATIRLTVDGQALPQEAVPEGSDKYVQAEKSVLVSSSNAGSIEVILNNTNLGLLGKDGQVLTDIPFTIDAMSVTKPSVSPK